MRVAVRTMFMARIIFTMWVRAMIVGVSGFMLVVVAVRVATVVRLSGTRALTS
jgi:hypothetical protein